MLSMILIAIGIAAACLWSAYQLDISRIERRIVEERHYTIGLTTRQWARRIWWQQADAEWAAFTQPIRYFFYDSQFNSYWWKQTGCILLLPTIRLSIDQERHKYAVHGKDAVKTIVVLEVSWITRWSAIEYVHININHYHHA